MERLPNGAMRTEPAHRLITVQDLLTHTSGLSYGYGTRVSAWKGGVGGESSPDRTGCGRYPHN